MIETDVPPEVLLAKERLLVELADCGARGFGQDFTGDGWSLANDLIIRVPDWIAAAGLLAAPVGRGFLAYLKPKAGASSYFPATVVLRFQAGHYSIESRECGDSRSAGIEIASAPPLVCSPPCSGRPLLLVITYLR